MKTGTRCWHHIVLTTYGAWLPGDPRGFRTPNHRQHVAGDYRNLPPAGKYTSLHHHSRGSLVSHPAKLTHKLKPIVGNALRERLTKLGAWVLCMSVSGQHVHLLAKLPVGSAREWCGLAKKHATFVLRDHDWQSKLWAARSHAILVRSREHQVRAYRYILRHADQGAWIGVWKEEPKAD